MGHCHFIARHRQGSNLKKKPWLGPKSSVGELVRTAVFYYDSLIPFSLESGVVVCPAACPVILMLLLVLSTEAQEG
jgi:hypothetical protein